MINWCTHELDIAILQHLLRLPLEHQLAVEVEIDLAGVHVKTSIEENLTFELDALHKVVHILALNLVQLVHHQEEAEHVERDVCKLG